MKEDAAMVTETYLLDQKGYEFALKGIEQVEGKDAYVVAVKTPAKREFTYYYDVTTGLRVKQSQVQEGPMGSANVSTYISDYKAFNGVQIPTRIVQDLGQMKIDIKFDDVKVNTGLKAEDIK